VPAVSSFQSMFPPEAMGSHPLAWACAEARPMVPKNGRSGTTWPSWLVAMLAARSIAQRSSVSGASASPSAALYAGLTIPPPAYVHPHSGRRGSAQKLDQRIVPGNVIVKAAHRSGGADGNIETVLRYVDSDRRAFTQTIIRYAH